MRNFLSPVVIVGSWPDRRTDSKSNAIRFVKKGEKYSSVIPSPREPFSRAWRGRNPITILVGMKGRYTRCFLFKCWRWKEIKIQFRFDSVRVYSRNRGRNSSIVSGGRYFPQMRYCFLSDIYFTSYSTHPIITSKKKKPLVLLQPPESTELATCVLCASPLIFGCLCGNLWMINFSPLLERRKDDAIFVPCLFIQRVSEWATPTQGTLFSGFGIPLDLFILLSRCWIQLIWFASLSSSSISVAYKVSSPLVYLLKSSRSGSLDTKSGMFSFKSRERERFHTRRKTKRLK